MAFQRNERAFLDGVLDRGEVSAGLLDIAPEIRARVKAMPMLAWKTRHVRENTRKGGPTGHAPLPLIVPSGSGEEQAVLTDRPIPARVLEAPER